MLFVTPSSRNHIVMSVQCVQPIKDNRLYTGQGPTVYKCSPKCLIAKITIELMSRLTNAILGVSALLTLVYICFVQLAHGLVSSLDVSSDKTYVIFFYSDNEPKTKAEEAEQKKHMTDLVDSYAVYVENTLESVVKHRYDTVLQGLAIELRNSEKLRAAFSKDSVGINKITPQDVYSVFYKYRQKDLEKWKIRLNVEKDQSVSVGDS